MGPGSWASGKLAPGKLAPGKLGWAVYPPPPRKLGVGVVIAPKKLEEVAYSPKKAGSPRKLPSQASKDGFHYMHLSDMANDMTTCDVTLWCRDIMWCHIMSSHDITKWIWGKRNRKCPTQEVHECSGVFVRHKTNFIICRSQKDDYMRSLARDNTQLLINHIWKVCHYSIDAEHVSHLSCLHTSKIPWAWGANQALGWGRKAMWQQTHDITPRNPCASLPWTHHQRRKHWSLIEEPARYLSKLKLGIW